MKLDLSPLSLCIRKAGISGVQGAGIVGPTWATQDGVVVRKKKTWLREQGLVLGPCVFFGLKQRAVSSPNPFKANSTEKWWEVSFICREGLGLLCQWVSRACFSEVVSKVTTQRKNVSKQITCRIVMQNHSSSICVCSVYSHYNIWVWLTEN